MPEGRMLKKVITESKSLGNLKSDSARLLYTWLIPFLDVEGRHSADPDIIQGHIFPKVKSMTVPRIRHLLLELGEEGLIVIYIDRTKDEPCLQLTKFHDHQKLDPGKEGKSKFPEPTSEDIENKITPEFSGVTLEKSALSKVKVKLSLREVKVKAKCPRELADVDIRLVQLLIDLMEKNNPDSLTLKNLTEERQAEWVNQCRLLREIDNRTEADIEGVIRFSQGDSFWQKNILSMPKLRMQWDQLWMKAKGSGESVQKGGFRSGDNLPSDDVYKKAYLLSVEKRKAQEAQS